MRTLIGLFEGRAEAKTTMNELRKLGARESNFSLLSTDGGAVGDLTLESIDVPGMGRVGACGPIAGYITRSAAMNAPDAIAAALVELGLPASEAAAYVDGVRRGYTLEAVTVEEGQAAQALQIMKDHSVGTRREAGAIREPAAQRAEEEIVIPVIAEELAVGKRTEEAGGMRVETHVEHVPVEQTATLREERVDVERRAVDRPATAAEAGEAFRDRAVEMVAQAEEPIVEKRAHVVEEVVLRKDVGTRTEAIKDTVQRTAVDIQKLDREHFDKTYAATGAPFESYGPAYKYGSDLREDSRFQAAGWEGVEPQARATWEERNPGTWDRFKAAIQHAWERAKS